jgi:hypothetical protein
LATVENLLGDLDPESPEIKNEIDTVGRNFGKIFATPRW